MISGGKKPDKSICNDQLQALQTMLNVYGLENFASCMLWILTKESKTFSSGKEAILIPFRFSLEQRLIHKRLGRNNLLLKARQIGGTTFFSLVRLLIPAMTEPGVGSLLISQSSEYAQKHFEIIRRAYRYIGVEDPQDGESNLFHESLTDNLLHTAYSNRRELIFDQLDSRIMVATAEVEQSSQGVTLHHVVASEYARWPHNPEATLSNVRGALVKTGTMDKECTANSASGPFFNDCVRAMNDPKNSDSTFHFFGWYFQEEYFLELTNKQRAELEEDLKADEIRLIAKMHKELLQVT